MSDPERIKEKPPVPQTQEKAREPTAPKTSQSAFDKIMEQQKVIQQSPALQSRFSEAAGQEQKVKEIGKWQDGHEERRKKDDQEDAGPRDKIKTKEKSALTVTREAIGKTAEKKGSGGGSGGGRDRGGFGSDMAKRQIIQKKLSEVRGLVAELGKSQFAGKMAQAKAAALNINPQQMQALVNKIVQSIQVGKTELGWPELKLILKDGVFSGLRLRFTSKNGKVSVKLDTANSKVRTLFENEAPKIKAALEEKGVVVEEIKIE